MNTSRQQKLGIAVAISLFIACLFAFVVVPKLKHDEFLFRSADCYYTVVEMVIQVLDDTSRFEIFQEQTTDVMERIRRRQ